MQSGEARVDSTGLIKRMRLRYAGVCARCGVTIGVGAVADYHRAARVVTCVECPPRARNGAAGGSLHEPSTAAMPQAELRRAEDVDRAPEAPVLHHVDGVAGASAAQEYRRRHDARRERVTGVYPRMGRLLLTVFDDPQSTQAWSIGAVGEQQLGGMLATIAGPQLRVLHDRRIPGSRANIDHLVVSPTGVHVVDAKRYRNQRPDVRVEGGLLTPRRRFLTVGGTDRSALVEGVSRQVQRVRAVLEGEPDVEVHGHLCFLDADWGLLQRPFTVDGVGVAWPRRLKKELAERGPLGADRIADVQWLLHQAFPRQN